MPSAEPQRTSPPKDERIGDRDLAHWRSAPGRLVAGWLAHVSVLVGRALRWSSANIALVLTVVIGLGVVAALTAGSAEVYENVVDRDGISVIDQPVLDAAVRMRTPLADRLATDFTNIGGPVGMPILALVVAVGLSLSWRRWMPLVLMAIASAGSLLITVTGKDLTARTRPPRALAVPPFESSASFPSGHTLNATVVLGLTAYLLVIWLRKKRWRAVTIAVATVLIAAMGLSRVFLGHHWFTDVVAGWAIGLGWLATVITGHRLRITLARRRRDGPAAG
ncbi:phosphatase PAP2 family protein [Knoellia sp. Soil729]|uniref:phosphatase PAP2 family protein n=1 Tax=Knoellia sp. Soil729 TaxID=1736394 RepID=UPI000702160A|nr:phosphatase PAP2 family protein [Knoellia sp. Soil729]KRE43606.1 phosphoesterase [Knoellia sp. Soil729]